ncbi:hypothetical protein NKH18_00930 [Streptomyces sp. M10(2022)]
MTTTAPATAAQSLAGLARVRPAGWLANPMPQDQEAVLARAREALERDHPDIDGRLTLLAARYTAAVVAVYTSAGTVVLKLHADPAAYAERRWRTRCWTGLRRSPPCTTSRPGPCRW